MKRKSIFVFFVCLIMLLPGCKQKEKAVNLYTSRNSPVIYNSILYFYSEDVTIKYENRSEQGIILQYPNKSFANIEKKELFFDYTDKKQSILVSNENNLLCNYISQEKIEESKRIEEIMEVYDDFIIEKQTISYEKDGNNIVGNAESVGKEALDKSIVKELEMQYGEVIYSIDDFENVDALFFVKAGCANDDDFLEKYTENGYFVVGDFYDTEIPEIFVGIILKKGNDYYYGNMSNKISDELIEKLGV